MHIGLNASYMGPQDPISSLNLAMEEVIFSPLTNEEPVFREVNEFLKELGKKLRVSGPQINVGSALTQCPFHAWSRVSEEITAKVCGIQSDLRGESPRGGTYQGCAPG